MTRRRFQPIDAWATVVLATTTAVTALVAGRVFADWTYLRPMLLVALVTHAVALVLRVVRMPGWLAVPLVAVAGGWALSLAYYQQVAGIVPDGATVQAVVADLRTALDLFPTAVAPVPSNGPFAVAAATALMAIVVLSDTFAFRANGHSEAIVPHGALFVVVAAVGTPLWRVELSLAWVAAALLTVGVLRARDRRDEALWVGNRPTRLSTLGMRIGAASALAAAVGALVAPHLPGAGDAALIDTRTGASNVTQIISPLVDIRSTLVDSSSSVLFTVSASDGPHYWRLLSLPTFDGTAWNPPAEDLEDVGRSTAGALADRSVQTTESRQRIRIESLRGPMVPAAYRPDAVDTDDDVFWAPDSESLIMPGRGLRTGTVVEVVSVVPELSPEALRAASALPAPSPEYLALPSNIADSVKSIAASVVGSASTDFDRALALQQWFRTEFEYTTDVDFSNSARAIEAFLEARRGFCQQFAGTFAVMARLLGLPARVAVGFTPGDRASDGSYRVYGRHAHAWPEVWFGGIGWVAFEPTPGRGSPDGAGYLGVPPQQDDDGASDTVPSTSTTAAPAATSTTTTAPPAGTTAPATTVAAAAASDPGPSAPVWWLVLAIALGAWIWRAPSAAASIARSRRRAAPSRSRVLGAWHRATRFATWAGGGAADGRTPREFAAAAGDRLSIGRRDIEALAAVVGRVAFSAHVPSDADAARCEELSDRIVAGCRPLLGRGRRAALRLAPWTEWPAPRIARRDR